METDAGTDYEVPIEQRLRTQSEVFEKRAANDELQKHTKGDAEFWSDVFGQGADEINRLQGWLHAVAELMPDETTKKRIIDGITDGTTARLVKGELK